MFHCQQGSPIKVHDVKSPEVPAEGPWSPQYTGPLLLLETSTEALSASLPHNYLVCVCHYHACWNHCYALMWWLPLLITNMSAPWVEDVNTLQRLSCKAPHIISYEFRSTKHCPGMNTTRTIYWLKSLWQFINSQNVSLFACKATWYGNDFHRGRWIPPWTWCSCQRWWWSPLAWCGHRKL